jgi:hypothetical protein
MPINGILCRERIRTFPPPIRHGAPCSAIGRHAPPGVPASERIPRPSGSPSSDTARHAPTPPSRRNRRRCVQNLSTALATVQGRDRLCRRGVRRPRSIHGGHECRSVGARDRRRLATHVGATSLGRLIYIGRLSVERTSGHDSPNQPNSQRFATTNLSVFGVIRPFQQERQG